MGLLVVIAMRGEARPVLEALDAVALEGLDHSPTEWFEAATESGRRVTVVVNGVDPVHGVDSIGTDAATLSTWLGIDRVSPQWVVSAGTAGGFESRGGSIGQTIVADGPIIHHDRRIPLAGFESYGRGEAPTADLSQIASELGLTCGPCSSGNSLDAPDHDLVAMAAHGTLAKDMEAAAVAHVAARRRVRFTAVKVLTDLVDVPHSTVEQFTANFTTATEALAREVPRVLDRLPR